MRRDPRDVDAPRDGTDLLAGGPLSPGARREKTGIFTGSPSGVRAMSSPAVGRLCE